MHPNDGKVHKDSHLCEILQVQSIQLCHSENNELNVSKTEIDKNLCERCRRFAVGSPDQLCVRCERVMKEL